MMCLDLWINGERRCRAGAPEADLVEVKIDLLPLDRTVAVSVSGSIPADGAYNHFASWCSCEAVLGDAIDVRIVEASEADSPTVAEHGVGSVEDAPNWGPICLFCGHSYMDVDAMIRGKRGFICKPCVAQVSSLLTERNGT